MLEAEDGGAADEYDPTAPHTSRWVWFLCLELVGVGRVGADFWFGWDLVGFLLWSERLLKRGEGGGASEGLDGAGGGGHILKPSRILKLACPSRTITALVGVSFFRS